MTPSELGREPRYRSPAIMASLQWSRNLYIAKRECSKLPGIVPSICSDGYSTDPIMLTVSDAEKFPCTVADGQVIDFSEIPFVRVTVSSKSALAVATIISMIRLKGDTKKPLPQNRLSMAIGYAARHRVTVDGAEFDRDSANLLVEVLLGHEEGFEAIDFKHCIFTEGAWTVLAETDFSAIKGCPKVTLTDMGGDFVPADDCAPFVKVSSAKPPPAPMRPSLAAPRY